jgi:hypothetical protein
VREKTRKFRLSKEKTIEAEEGGENKKDEAEKGYKKNEDLPTERRRNKEKRKR